MPILSKSLRAALLGAATLLPLAAPLAAETVKLTLLGVGDVYNFAENKGRGGFARILAYLLAETGTRAAAADQTLGARKAVNDSVRRADAEQGAVDLDAEAARMLELQQNYQAAAQVMSVAQEMFDTLINSL